MMEEEEVVDGGEEGSFIEGEGGRLIWNLGRGASAVREAVEGGGSFLIRKFAPSLDGIIIIINMMR
jgi:hypothetical protein